MNERKKRLALRAAFGLVAAFGAFAGAAKAFEPARPVATPSDWTASAPDSAKKVGSSGEIFELTGNGEASEWRSASVRFEPRKLYRLDFKASTAREGSGDCAPCGTTFAHYDFNGFPVGETPKKGRSFVFFVPDNATDAPLRFAQWETRRVYRFSEPKISAVQPIFSLIPSGDSARSEVLELGNGESIDSGRYRFTAFSAATNYDRPLYSTTSSFNTDRWTLGGEATVVYRFALEATALSTESTDDGEKRGEIGPSRSVPFAGGSVSAAVGYYVGGKVVVEASFDAENWSALGELDGLGEKEFALDAFFANKTPDEFFVRLRAAKGDDGTWCSAQISGFSVAFQTVPADADAFKGAGRTIFAALGDDADESAPNRVLWGFDEENDEIVAREDAGRFVASKLGSELIPIDESARKDSSDGLNDDMRRVDEERFVARFARPASFSIATFPYFRQDFTREIAGLEGDVGNVRVSWCEPDVRVPRDPRRVEIQAAAPARIAAPKNDYESFQVVLQSNDGLTGVAGEVLGDLVSESGATISRENVDLRYAYYHYVDVPTDHTCVVGYYPDALVPLELGADGKGASLDALPGKNLPIWVTVKIPADAAAGTYRGAVRLTSGDGASNGVDAKIPFELTVWDFALPAKNAALETAFGVSPGTIWRYHNCQTEADKRTVFNKYLKMFGDYRISPYNPAPLDEIAVRWLPDENPPRCELDFSRFDAEMKRVFEEYNFSNFQLHFSGLGYGTYENRTPGSIAGFAADSPQYQAMMRDYGAKMQEHLREIGLLDAAYVYWFDEPEPKDYEFCANGFATLKKYAPDIARMLTEEPSPEFEKILDAAGGDVDVWCPISNMYSDESAKPERAKENRFWQYVCTGPKAPYCTEFTDHPAIELRIWHWQMFERNIVGSLIWESTYWTSDAAYPDEAQNPYLDPESYVSGYSTPAGTKRRWGNGDGRFIYPPLTAATPGRNDGKPIFDDPVASIRWEMLREGVQDYEMLATLARLTKERDLTPTQRKKVEEIFDFSPITTDMTTFSLDPRRIYDKRRAAAEAIVELSR